MKVTVSFEYNSVEEAILALGKQAGVAKVRRAAATTGAAPESQGSAEQHATVVAVPAAAPTTRKGRSDKGKARGPHKEAAVTGSTASSTSGEPAGGAAPDSNPASADAPIAASTAAVTAASPTIEDAVIVAKPEEVQAAIEKLYESQANAPAGIAAVKDLLARYGCTKGRDIPAERRFEFIKEAKSPTVAKAA